jgi:hypothetical protein
MDVVVVLDILIIVNLKVNMKAHAEPYVCFKKFQGNS